MSEKKFIKMSVGDCLVNTTTGDALLLEEVSEDSAILSAPSRQNWFVVPKAVIEKTIEDQEKVLDLNC